ncbi:MAG: phosphatase PAP2 family protein [Ginsengibacter sp.]
MNKFNISFITLLLFILSQFFKSLYRIDLHLLEYINHERIKPLDSFLIFITNTSYYIAFAIPTILLIYAFIKNRGKLKRQCYLLLSSLIINSLIIYIIKRVVNRQRPFEVDSFIEKLTSAGSPSFPSGHTGDVFLIATALTLLFSKQRWWLLVVWIWAFIVAYSRLALGVHYPSDVVASMIISSSIAIGVNSFFRSRNFLNVDAIS